MKLLSTIVLSLLLSAASVAQTYIAQVKPYGKKDWGYINQKGDFVIQPQYRTCYGFSDNGLAVVNVNKKYAFINTKNEQIKIDVKNFKLYSVFGFGLQGYSDGMVAVKVGDNWGYLDTSGKLAIELKYDKATAFDKGYAIVKKADTYYIIDKKGVETEIKDVASVKPFVNGYAPFTDFAKMVGFINNKGEKVVSASFVSVGEFENGVAWAKNANKKIGFINAVGKWVIEPGFLSAKNFDAVSGLARVKTLDGWAYTNIDGEIIKIDTESFGDFNDGLAKGKKGGKIGYYNNKGEWIVAPEFDGGNNFKNGFAAIKKGKKWGFVNTAGEIVVEPAYAGVKFMEKVN